LQHCATSSILVPSVLSHRLAIPSIHTIPWLWHCAMSPQHVYCDTHVWARAAPFVTSTGTCTAPPAMLTGLGVRPPRSCADRVRVLTNSFR
jgi:hypothetical protein